VQPWLAAPPERRFGKNATFGFSLAISILHRPRGWRASPVFREEPEEHGLELCRTSLDGLAELFELWVALRPAEETEAVS
jgi:hypothetical protein